MIRKIKKLKTQRKRIIVFLTFFIGMLFLMNSLNSNVVRFEQGYRQNIDGEKFIGEKKDNNIIKSADATNFNISILDLENKPISGAFVNISYQDGGEVTLSNNTNNKGIVSFFNVPSGVMCDLKVVYEYTREEKNITILNQKPAFESPIDFNTFTFNANLTTFNITVSDEGSGNGLIGATVQLINTTTEEIFATTDTNIDGSGLATLRIPEAEYKLRILYGDENISYLLPQLGVYDPPVQDRVISLNTEIDGNETYDVVCVLNEFHTEINFLNAEFQSPVENGNWLEYAKYTAPYELGMYYENTVRLKFQWLNTKTGNGVTAPEEGNIWNTWTLKRDGKIVNSSTITPNAIEQVPSESGNYSINIRSEDYNAGDYLFRLKLNRSDYQDGIIYFSIEIKNFTTDILKNSTGNIEVQYNAPLNLGFNYTSLIPYQKNIQNAILNYEIESESYSGTLDYSSTNEMYVLSDEAMELPAGIYNLKIWGNTTNYQKVSKIYILEVKALNSELDVIVSPEYRISPNYMKTTVSENVTFLLNYTNIMNNPIEITKDDISITVDQTALPDEYLYQLDSETYNGLWNISFPSTYYGSSSLVDTISITIQKPNYEKQNFELTLELKPYWNTTIDLITPPDPYVWGDNISLSLRYSSNEDPSPMAKAGSVIDNAEFDYLNISTKNGLDYETVVQLDEDEINSIWGWKEVENQPGHYSFWVLTNHLDLSEETRYYLIPQLSKDMFQTMDKKDIYIDLSLLDSDLNCFNKSDLGEELLFFSLDNSKNEKANILCEFEVSDENSHLYGNPINNKSLNYKVYDKKTNNLVENGELNFTGNGNYEYIIDSSELDLGEYNFTVLFDSNNYTTSSASFDFNITTKIDFTFTIPDEFKLGTSTMRAALNENFTFYLNISDEVASYEIEIKFDGQTTSGVIYNLGNDEYIVTNQSLSLSTGMHTIDIIVSVSGNDYIYAEKTIYLEIIEKWDTLLEVVTPANDAIWGENISFVLKYTVNQAPRNGTLIEGAEFRYIYIDQLETMGYEKLLGDGELGWTWSFHEISENPGHYFAEFNSSVIKANEIMYPKIFVDIEEKITGLYQNFNEISEGTRLLGPRVIPVGTGITYTATPTPTTQFSEGFSFISLRTGEESTVILDYFVDDITSPFNGMSLRNIYPNEVNIQYTVINQSNGQIIESGSFLPNNNDNSTWNLTFAEANPNYLHEEYSITIEASVPNYEILVKEFAMIIGESETQYDYDFVYPELYQGNPGQENLYRMASSENLTIDLDINGLEYGIEPSLTISLYQDNSLVKDLALNDLKRIDSNTIRFDREFNISEMGISPGYYELRILCNLPGLLPTEKSFTIDMMDYWPAKLHVVNPPMVYSWGNMVNMNLSYYVETNIYETYPRNGDLISQATMTGLDILLILEDETELKLHLSQENITQGIWGYQEMIDSLGIGYYKVWFNTSFIDLTEEEIQTYYLIPTIQKGINSPKEARPKPNYSIYPVPTSFIMEQKSNITDLELSNMQVYLEDDLSIHLFYNVTDDTSIFYKNYLGTAQLSFEIIDRSTGELFKQGYLESYSNGTFYWEIPTGIIGNYSVLVKAEKTNFVTQELEFGLLVKKYEISYSLDETMKSEIVDFPRNQNQTVVLNLEDWRTGEPLVGATVLVEFNDQILTCEDLGNGHYAFTISPEVVKNLEVGNSYPAQVIVNKANYSTPEDFTVQLRLNLPIDPYFGIPYAYWIVIGTVSGLFMAAVVARRLIKKSKIPTVIKKIDQARNIIKKDDVPPDENLTPTPKEEMYGRFHEMWDLINLDMVNMLEMEQEEIDNLNEELMDMLELANNEDKVKDLEEEIGSMKSDIYEPVESDTEVHTEYDKKDTAELENDKKDQEEGDKQNNPTEKFDNPNGKNEEEDLLEKNENKEEYIEDN